MAATVVSVVQKVISIIKENIEHENGLCINNDPLFVLQCIHMFIKVPINILILYIILLKAAGF